MGRSGEASCIFRAVLQLLSTQKQDHPAVHHTFLHRFSPISQKVAYTPGQRRIVVCAMKPRDHSFRSGGTYGPIRQDCLRSDKTAARLILLNQSS